MGAYITALRQTQDTAGAYETPKKTTEETSNSDITKQMFLKLLVAQISNQDPLQPQDGVEFISQLAEFSNLEQIMGIRGELEAIHAEMQSAATTGEGTTQQP